VLFKSCLLQLKDLTSSFIHDHYCVLFNRNSRYPCGRRCPSHLQCRDFASGTGSKAGEQLMVVAMPMVGETVLALRQDRASPRAASPRYRRRHPTTFTWLLPNGHTDASFNSSGSYLSSDEDEGPTCWWFHLCDHNEILFGFYTSHMTHIKTSIITRGIIWDEIFGWNQTTLKSIT
jgi:hypothetical protein